MARQTKEEKQKIKKRGWIISSILFVFVVLLLSVSLFFSVELEELLKLEPNMENVEETALEVHFVDVGQGDAILIRFPNEETMLVDAGPNKAQDYLLNYIDNIFFSSDEEKYFDYVLLTHGDADHSGGMLKILETYPVEVFYRPATTVAQQDTVTYRRVIEKAENLQKEGQSSVITSQEGITIKDNENVMAEFLSPNDDYYDVYNNYSPIVMLNYEGKKILLTGDSEAVVEGEVIDNFTAENKLSELDVDVLKVGHHGSRSSSSIAFLDVIKPEYAVISVAKQNSYNHPHDETITNLTGVGVESIYRTSERGNIVCYVNQGQEISFLCIENSDEYLFIDWYIIVIICVIVSVFLFLAFNLSRKKLDKAIKKEVKKLAKRPK